MKNHFLQLLGYDRFANLAILNSILEAADRANAVKVMAHLLAAQRVWLNRCKGLPPPLGLLWPDEQAGNLQQHINTNYNEWVTYLNELQTEDFENIIAYKNFQGDSYENKLIDILTHLINHGTHHRAQAGQHLKQAGLEKLPVTDYIFYIR